MKAGREASMHREKPTNAAPPCRAAGRAESLDRPGRGPPILGGKLSSLDLPGPDVHCPARVPPLQYKVFGSTARPFCFSTLFPRAFSFPLFFLPEVRFWGHFGRVQWEFFTVSFTQHCWKFYKKPFARSKKKKNKKPFVVFQPRTIPT
jgi:hypothetical protein